MNPVEFPLAVLNGTQSGKQLVLQTVEAQPGLCKSDVVAHTGLSWGTIHYYVERLTDTGELTTMADGRRLRLFIGNGPPNAQLAIAMARPLAAKILDALEAGISRSGASLAEEIGVSSRQAHRELGRLVAAGLVNRHGVYRPMFQLRLN